MIKFQSKYAPMLFATMGKDDVRPYLNGIFITPAKDKGCYLVSTNGHMLMVIYDLQGVCDKESIISLNKDALKFCIKGSVVEIDTEAKRLKIIDGRGFDGRGFDGKDSYEWYERYLQPNNCLIEGTFPDWAKVVPDFTKLVEGASGALQARYVEQLARVGNSVRGYNPAGIQFWHEKNSKGATVVQFCEIPEAMALVMPIRYDGTPFDDKLREILKKDAT